MRSGQCWFNTQCTVLSQLGGAILQERGVLSASTWKREDKGAAGWQRQQQRPAGDVAAALAQIWAPTGCSHSQEAHPLGCEQRRGAAPKIAWQEEKPVLGLKLEKNLLKCQSASLLGS